LNWKAKYEQKQTELEATSQSKVDVELLYQEKSAEMESLHEMVGKLDSVSTTVLFVASSTEKRFSIFHYRFGKDVRNDRNYSDNSPQ